MVGIGDGARKGSGLRWVREAVVGSSHKFQCPVVSRKLSDLDPELSSSESYGGYHLISFDKKIRQKSRAFGKKSGLIRPFDPFRSLILSLLVRLLHILLVPLKDSGHLFTQFVENGLVDDLD